MKPVTRIIFNVIVMAGGLVAGIFDIALAKGEMDKEKENNA